MGMLPIVSQKTWPGGWGTVNVTTLVPFKIVRIVSDGAGHWDVVGHVIKQVDGVGPGGVGQTVLPGSSGFTTLNGATGIRLVQ
jgi:hypothetical protein